MNDEVESKSAEEKNLTSSAQGKKTILIALSGGPDSAVAAFLLKRQGHTCIGVSLVLYDQNLEMPEAPTFSNSCSVKDLKEVKKICDFLDIPFYAVNAQPEFTDMVLDPMVSQALAGETFIPCMHCNNVKIQLLLQKAALLKCDYVATGHYAKLQENIYTSNVSLQAGNDRKNDQSYLLANLQQEHLKKLLLPLADLRKEEVLKIADRFRIPYVKNRRDSSQLCFQEPEGRKLFIEKRAAPKLRQEGHILKNETFDPLGEHTGVHQFVLGQGEIRSTLQADMIDKNLKVVKIDSYNRKIFLGPEQSLQLTSCLITRLNFADDFDRTRPQTFYVQFGINLPKVSTKLFFKNNQTALLEFAQPIYALQIGQSVVIYDRPEMKAKLLASGVVSYIGDTSVHRRTDGMAKPKDKDKKEHKDEKKKKPRKDFVF